VTVAVEALAMARRAATAEEAHGRPSLQRADGSRRFAAGHKSPHAGAARQPGVRPEIAESMIDTENDLAVRDVAPDCCRVSHQVENDSPAGDLGVMVAAAVV
jgi:hypothetical protein